MDVSSKIAKCLLIPKAFPSLMESQLIFLGTGGDAFLVGKHIRGAGGIILKSNGLQFHIDPGPGALTAARQYGINLRENIAVLVSHAHTNHCNDINAVINAMSYAGLDVKGVLIANNTVVNGNENTYPILTNFHKKCVEKVIVAKLNKKIGIENIEIQPLKAEHTDPDALGFKFFTSEFVLSYTGDTKYTKEVVEQHKNSDILIMNVKFPADAEERTHLNTDDAIKLLNKARPRLAIITHFGNKMHQADPISEAREIQLTTDVQTIAAKDGLTINPISYAAGLRQKTLNLY